MLRHCESQEGPKWFRFSLSLFLLLPSQQANFPVSQVRRRFRIALLNLRRHDILAPVRSYKVRQEIAIPYR
jgi:hypothetical protein